MTINEAKKIFLDRGLIEIDGTQVFDGNKWREAYIILSEWLRSEDVNPQLKTGHWVEYKPDYHRCSNCNKDAFAAWNAAKKDNVDILTDYCPNCGAKMVESEE